MLSTWDVVFWLPIWKTSICLSRPSSNISCSTMFLQVPQGKDEPCLPPKSFYFLLFCSLLDTGSSFAVFTASVKSDKGLQLCLLPCRWPGSLQRSCTSHVFHKHSGFGAGRRAAPHGRFPACFLPSHHCLLQLPHYVILFCPLSIYLSKKLGPFIQCSRSILLT